VLDNFLAMFRLHRESNLLACVTDDFSISIVDIDNRYKSTVERIITGGRLGKEKRRKKEARKKHGLIVGR
jgi:hypothetical protein